jgi:hypothetical protein
MMKNIKGLPPKPEKIYVARKVCGCCVGICNDYGDKATGKMVAEFIAEGLTVTNVTWQEYVERVSNEPTFMKCSHGETETQQAQMKLRGV